MISSMTGYGSSSVQKGDFTAEVEIKSLNSRFLDIFLKLPKNLNDRELEIRNIIKNNIKRGKVSVSVYIEKNGINNRIANVKDEKFTGVVNLLNELKNKAGIESELTLENILAFQNIFFSEDSGENEEEFKLSSKAILKAIQDLNSMRKKEGKLLADDLKTRIDNIKAAVVKIEDTNPKEINSYFEKLKTRAKELLENLTDFDDRLKTELALIAERYDVTEECVRLKSHIEQFVETLNAGNEVGRRLNFLSQEMNREANTINSKSISTEVTNYGIFIKEELEKIREQIQNIE